MAFLEVIVVLGLVVGPFLVLGIYIGKVHQVELGDSSILGVVLIDLPILKGGVGIEGAVPAVIFIAYPAVFASEC